MLFDELVKKFNLTKVTWLRDNGVDFNVTSEDGVTLTHLLVERFNSWNVFDEARITRIFKLLLRQGCRINAKDKNGNSPIHVAAVHPNIFVIRSLIECGADVNCRNNQRETPLHLVVASGQMFEVVDLLLQHGAIVDARDSQGRTALHVLAALPTVISREITLRGMLVVLVEYGADINARDVEGLSALSYGRRRDSQEYEQERQEYFHNYGKWLGMESIDDYGLPETTRETTSILARRNVELKALNLPWDDIINSWPQNYVENSEKYNERCTSAIEKLKNTFIDSRTSLYNWLHMDLKHRVAYADNDKLLDILFLGSDFSVYTDIVKGRIRETRKRKSLLGPAKEAWYELTEIALPDICVERILDFLSNENLFDMIERN